MQSAIVHEYLNQYGGAERVLEALDEVLFDAPIYTTIYDRERTNRAFDNRIVRTSFIQSLPFAKSRHHIYAPLMPIAIEQFDFRAFDTILSVSASFAKGIISHTGARHICYCLTPPRFLWDDSHEFVDRFSMPWILRPLSPLALSYFRVWDVQAASRVDKWIAISETVRRRIQKYYKADAVVIPPPVDVNRFSVATRPGEFWLAVGRLVAYKRFDIVIDAFNRLGWPLIIAGTGVEEKRLRALAGPTIRFTGSVSDAKLADLYTRSCGVVFPQEEDFGIVPLEAMASGRPVVAYRAGGATETIIEKTTGIFFDEQNAQSLADAVIIASSHKWDANTCRQHAEKYSTAIFQERMHEAIGSTL